MSASIRIIDHGAKKRIAALVKAPRSVLVGVQGAAAQKRAEGSPLTVGEIAAIHELGLGVPMRSWLLGWMEEQAARINQALRSAGEKIAAGRMTKDQAADVLGALFVGWIQARISAGIEPPNAESTIARKGSSTPLIDTGQLRSAMTWLVEGRA